MPILSTLYCAKFRILSEKPDSEQITKIVIFTLSHSSCRLYQEIVQLTLTLTSVPFCAPLLLTSLLIFISGLSARRIDLRAKRPDFRFIDRRKCDGPNGESLK